MRTDASANLALRRELIAADARRARAWLLLVGALGVHVIDEASTGFLAVYNPIVLSIRSRTAWFPMPTFSFGTWLGGLIVLVLVLASLTPVVRSGGLGIRTLCVVFAVLMFLNGLGHLAGSVYLVRWLPGATSAPLLLISSVLLVCASLTPAHA